MQRSLVKEMNQTKNDDQRINWRVDEQDNTLCIKILKDLVFTLVYFITIFSISITMR